MNEFNQSTGKSKSMNTFIRRVCGALSSIAVCVALFLATPASNAQSTSAPASSEATHVELRALRDALLEAWQHRDVDAMLTHVAPNVVVTWQNGEVSRGAAGVRKFYDEVLNSPDKIVANIASTLNVDEL